MNPESGITKSKTSRLDVLSIDVSSVIGLVIDVSSDEVLKMSNEILSNQVKTLRLLESIT